MRQAINLASTSAKFTAGLGVSTMFLATMDDVIYSNFRKNVIMPIQMVCVKSPQGQLQSEDVKKLAQGTKSFISEMQPHALMPTNAKELILKDADYSTPQDHYFGYTQQDRNLINQGMTIAQVNDYKRQEELRVIHDLFNDQEGRVESIERHIEALETKRKPKSMSELFEGLTDSEKVDIEKNWGTTLGELQKLAAKHDIQAAEDAKLPEERRFKRDNSLLENMDMNQIMSVAVSKTKSVEYQATDDPFTLSKDQLVSIKPKSKKRPKQPRKALREASQQAEEREKEIQALLAQPDQTGVVQRAAELASESRLQASDVSDKEMQRLRRLRSKATQADVLANDQENNNDVRGTTSELSQQKESSSSEASVRLSSVVSPDNIQ